LQEEHGDDSATIATDQRLIALDETNVLHGMGKMAILIHMKTTLNIDDGLLAQARKLTGIEEKTALVREGLEALIARESARRLAALGGSERQLRPIRRRRDSTRTR
jgi:Arc/MetJ family transcription regulator